MAICGEPRSSGCVEEGCGNSHSHKPQATSHSDPESVLPQAAGKLSAPLASIRLFRYAFALMPDLYDCQRDDLCSELSFICSFRCTASRSWDEIPGKASGPIRAI